MSTSRPDASADLPAWLQYLESIHAKAIDLGLDRVRQVAGRLDLSLDGVNFVVGGTNGKGSTCAMLESILLAAGYRVACTPRPISSISTNVPASTAKSPATRRWCSSSRRSRPRAAMSR
ncbi:bifunctional folylpolyglutamate synthase/dihydrofolate synthase [Bordetella pertussis]|nr:bifunctional folylpolyglutamate synthase/dihydrofolate synthase [Bordetella pertussis]